MALEAHFMDFDPYQLPLPSMVHFQSLHLSPSQRLAAEDSTKTMK